MLYYKALSTKPCGDFLLVCPSRKSKRKQSGDCPRPSASKEEKKKYDVNYDTQRQRNTWDRCVHGRPWLMINDGIMTCTEHKESVKPLWLLISRNSLHMNCTQILWKKRLVYSCVCLYIYFFWEDWREIWHYPVTVINKS